MLRFEKLQALGNDFVLVDRMGGGEPLSPDLARLLCDRHRGVGADGVLVVWPDAEADGRMQLLNADGSESGMCGNGLRLVAYHLYQSGHVPGDRSALTVRAGDGVHRVERVGPTRYRVAMHPAILSHAELPPEASAGTVRLEGNGATFEASCLHLGNPHAVIFAPDAEPMALAARHGAALEHHPGFVARTNVSFVRPDGERLVAVVHERGVGITEACGSGACAIASAAVARGLAPVGEKVRVALPGGELEVTVHEDGAMWLEGDVSLAFQGTWERA